MADCGKVLVVDDDPAVRDVISQGLTRKGFNCTCAGDATEALLAMERQHFELAITDLRMPGQNGIWLLEQCKKLHPELAVIVLTGISEAHTAADCLRYGADDYLMKPIRLDELAISSERTIEKARLIRQNRQYQETLEEKVIERTIELNQALDTIERTYQTTLEALVAALDTRESETGCHSLRVTQFTLALARKMGVPDDQMVGISRGALLHDIGKLGVRDSILLKPGKLTEEEWTEMKKHPELGYQMLKRIPFLGEASLMVLSHQEHWDGNGYPYGLSGNEIPQGARIFAVADTLDAMTSDRPYRKALPFSTAKAEITRCSGTQFDPEVVEAFLSIPDVEWERMKQAPTDTKSQLPKHFRTQLEITQQNLKPKEKSCEVLA